MHLKTVKIQGLSNKIKEKPIYLKILIYGDVACLGKLERTLKDNQVKEGRTPPDLIFINS